MLIVIPVSASIITFRSDLMGNVIEDQSQKPEPSGKQNKRNLELGGKSLKVDLEKRKLAR